MTEPEESSWRVRAGGGLLINAPLGEVGKEMFRNVEETEQREEQAARDKARDEELLKIEADRERAFLGVEKITVRDVLARVADPVNPDGTPRTRRDGTPVTTRDPQDAFPYQGAPGLDDPQRPHYTTLLREAREARLEREAALELEPASKAELDRGLTKLANAVSNAIGRRFPV